MCKDDLRPLAIRATIQDKTFGQIVAVVERQYADSSGVFDLRQLLELLKLGKGRFIALGDNEFVALSEEFHLRLAGLAAYGELHGKGVRVHPLAAFALEELAAEGNPAVEDQASDRAHRMGQLRPVTIYRLVAKHTIEETIVSLHKHKRDLADSLLEGSDMAARMSADEMMRMLQEGLAG